MGDPIGLYRPRLKHLDDDAVVRLEGMSRVGVEGECAGLVCVFERPVAAEGEEGSC